MRAIIFISMLLAGCSTPISTPTPDIVQMCEQTVRDYGPLRDDGPVKAYADLFTENGTFELGNAVTEGREALIARHVTANKASRWRHNMVDVRITDGDPITGTTRFIIYVGETEVGSTSVVREIIGDYLDTFRVEDGRCKIAARKVKIVFDSLR